MYILNCPIPQSYQSISYVFRADARLNHPYFISFHQNTLLMEIIERSAYLSHIISHLGKGMMIILVGQRRFYVQAVYLLGLEEAVARSLATCRPYATITRSMLS